MVFLSSGLQVHFVLVGVSIYRLLSKMIVWATPSDFRCWSAQSYLLVRLNSAYYKIQLPLCHRVHRTRQRAPYFCHSWIMHLLHVRLPEKIKKWLISNLAKNIWKIKWAPKYQIAVNIQKLLNNFIAIYLIKCLMSLINLPYWVSSPTCFQQRTTNTRCRLFRVRYPY